jgi:type I restriction enzyme, R subunit
MILQMQYNQMPPNLAPMNKANELPFQNDIISELRANGWLLGESKNYNRELALYSEDLLGFVQETQPQQWQKFCALYPNNADEKFLERVANQLNKSDPNAAPPLF